MAILNLALLNLESGPPGSGPPRHLLDTTLDPVALVQVEAVDAAEEPRDTRPEPQPQLPLVPPS